MLSNTQIREKSHRNQLICGFDESCLKNCSYRLRIGKLVKPHGTQIIDFTKGSSMEGPQGIWNKTCYRVAKWLHIKKDQSSIELNGDRFELKPNELVLFQTVEKVKLPLRLSASYAALDSVAKQGILLINASMVEPGYEGYLSGVLLNFSSKSFMIKPCMEIAKINFHEITGEVEDKVHENIEDYTGDLQDKAQNYTQTFLDVDRIENEVIAKTARRVKKSFLMLAMSLGEWPAS